MSKDLSKPLFLLFSLACSLRFAAAQPDFDRPAAHIRVEDGLPNYYFRGLATDANGFLWIGSYDGLSRFDGSRVEVFRHRPGDSTSLAHNAVTSLAADPLSGKVWIGTYGGLSVYDPGTGVFRSYYQEQADSNSLLSDFVHWVYADRQGEVWVSSGTDVLCRFDPEREGFSRYYPRSAAEGAGTDEQGAQEKILAVCQDRKDDAKIWIATNRRFFSFNKESRTFDYQKPILANIRQIFPHTDGNLYLRDEAGGIKVYDPARNSVIWEGMPPEGWAASRIFRRSDETLWLSCNKGVAMLDVSDFSFSLPWVNDPQRNENYSIALIDSQDRIWSAGNSGLRLYDPVSTQFRNAFCETPAGERSFIPQRLLEDTLRKAIFITANGGDGLYRYDLGTREWSVIPPPEDYDADAFHGNDLAFGKDGDLLILESIEIFTLSEDGRSMRVHPVSSALPKGRNWINFFVDSRGMIWLANKRDGVWRVDPATGRAESLEDHFPGCDLTRYRYAFYEDSRHNVWISACSGFGFYAYERDDVFMLPYAEGASNENTFKIARDFAEDSKGLIWVSSELDAMLGQISVDRPEEGIFRKFSLRHLVDVDSASVSKGSDRFALDVSKLAVDADDNIWTISSDGLLRFNPVLKTIEVFNQRDGLQWLDEELNVVTVNQIESLSSGGMATAFRKGLSVFDPSDLTASREIPEPYLVSFKVFNNERLTGSSLFHTRFIDLAHDENYFSFEFSSVGFTHPEHYRYRYKLEGVDKDWVEAEGRRYAAYTNVDGGNYTFLVQVANSDGIWNEEPLSVKLKVRVPWWRQPWFRLGVLLLILAAVFTFYRYRMEQVRKAERLKADFENKLANVELTALRAQMNPHFLFNCLNSIDYFILKNETRKASEYLQDFSRLIRLILQNSRSHYVSLKDELEALTLYMEMEKLRFNQRFDFEVVIENGEEWDLEDAEIPPMLIQPFVENAIWHGLMHKEEKGNIKVVISRESGLLKCVIEDNGIGRKMAAELKPKVQKKKSMGMSITRERIDLINKLYETDTTVRITDLVDSEGHAAGTRVELTIPI